MMPTKRANNGKVVSSLTDSYWYEAPFLQCGLERPDTSFKNGCNSSIPLPYDNLPRTDHEQLLLQNISQLEWPSDEWTIFSGCRSCGLVSTRGRQHLVSEAVVKKSEGRFRNDATLYIVEFPCADIRCKAPTRMYVEIPDGIVAGLLGDMQGLKFHGALPCGHPIKPVPSPLCTVSQVVNRLW